MQSLYRMAIQVAYPFGGYVRPDKLPIIEHLVKKGRIEIVAYDSLHGGNYYELTKRGKKLAKRLNTNEGKA